MDLFNLIITEALHLVYTVSQGQYTRDEDEITGEKIKGAMRAASGGLHLY